MRVDHPGSLLDRTSEGVYVARGVDSPFFGVLYDIYHSAVEGEDIEAELTNAGSIIKYVQLADAPGRGEPGTGDLDWPATLAVLRGSGLRRADRPGVLPAGRLRGIGALHPRRGGTGMTGRYPESVDVAIVGSGPAGAAYARILSETSPGATIAMFEVGPTVTNPPGAHVKNIADPAERARAQTRSEGPHAQESSDRIGGIVKTDAAPRPAGDVPARERLPGRRRGRPSRRGHVEQRRRHGRPLDRRVPAAERQRADRDPRRRRKLRRTAVRGGAAAGRDGRRVRQLAVRPLVRDRLAAAEDAGRIATTRVQRMPLAVHRREDGNLVWSGSDVVFGDVTRANPRFTLFDESLVTRVLVEDGRAAGVVVTDRRTGESSRGPRAIRRRGRGRPAHSAAAVGVRHPSRRPRALPERPGADRLRRAHPRSRAGGDGDGAGATGLSEYSGVTWVPFTDDMPFHGQVMQLDASPVKLAEDDPAAPGSIVGLGLFCAKDLQASDRVEFSDDEVDGYGMPAMTLHYRLTERDHEVIARGKEEIVRLGKAVGEPLDDRPFVMPLGASLHYQGTTRLGAD